MNNLLNKKADLPLILGENMGKLENVESLTLNLSENVIGKIGNE